MFTPQPRGVGLERELLEDQGVMLFWGLFDVDLRRVMRVISGRTPMRAGKIVSPRPVFTYRYCLPSISMSEVSPESPPLESSMQYSPRYCGNRYLLGLQPKRENCIEWV